MRWKHKNRGLDVLGLRAQVTLHINLDGLKLRQERSELQPPP